MANELVIPRTSYTLLHKMAHPSFGADYQGAWTEFTEKYASVIAAWGRKYGLPWQDQGDFLQGVYLRLLKYLKYWEFRRWLRIVARDAAEAVAAVGRFESKGEQMLSNMLADIDENRWGAFKPIYAGFAD